MVGEEQRDSGYANDKDTLNFARLYHETPKGGEAKKERVKQEYQEEGGVAFVKKIKRDEAKILEKRR